MWTCARSRLDNHPTGVMPGLPIGPGLLWSQVAKTPVPCFLLWGLGPPGAMPTTVFGEIL